MAHYFLTALSSYMAASRTVKLASKPLTVTEKQELPVEWLTEEA